jgi:hypothetical protein
MAKTIVIAAVLLLAGATLSHDQSNQNQNSSTGRFQIFQLDHDYHDQQKQTTLTVKEIFRLDTVTGRTVVYDEGVSSKGEYYSRWDQPIAEP